MWIYFLSFIVVPFLNSIILMIDSSYLLSETVLQNTHFSAGLFANYDLLKFLVGVRTELCIFSERDRESCRELLCQTPFGLLSPVCLG